MNEQINKVYLTTSFLDQTLANINDNITTTTSTTVIIIIIIILMIF